MSNTNEKRCVVLNCNSTTANDDLHFIYVPRDARQREIWIKRMKPLSVIRDMHCCQLHFDIENDCVNYDDYKQQHQGFRRYLKLKKGVVPHKNLPLKSVEEVIIPEVSSTTHFPVDMDRIAKSEIMQTGNSRSSGRSKNPLYVPSHDNLKDVSSDEETIIVKHSLLQAPSANSLGKLRHIEEHVSSSPASGATDLASTTELLAQSDHRSCDVSLNVENDINPSSQGSLYLPSINASSSTRSVPSTVVTDGLKLIKKTQLEFTMEAMRANSKRYMGIPAESFHLINILEEVTQLSERDLFIIFRKVRRDEPYWLLADCISLSISSIGRIINEGIHLVSEAMEEFIIWPDQEEIQYNLPNSFKHRYGAVNTIIDCFEIQIQKPSNAVHQTLSYSSYKKCNTIKYLIGCLPDGTINYISKGAGGRTSDQELVRQSGFLEKLTENTMVMADRGFKAIETDLRKKKCNLVRPPSTVATETMTKATVMENKRIASLRIHIERAIGRLREFAILKPHATIDNKLVSKTDFFVNIACGLCNIQTNLIQNKS